MDRLIQMIINTVLRRFISHGVKTGIDHFAGGGKPKSQMTSEERQQVQNAKATAKRARMAASVIRRLGR